MANKAKLEQECLASIRNGRGVFRTPLEYDKDFLKKLSARDQATFRQLVIQELGRIELPLGMTIEVEDFRLMTIV